MPTLMIAYEPGQTDGAERRHVVEAIMGLGTRWARPLAALWYVEGAVSCAEVEAELSPLLHDDDALLVQEIVGLALFANTTLRWTPSRRSCRINQSGSVDRMTSNVIAWPSRIPAAA